MDSCSFKFHRWKCKTSNMNVNEKQGSRLVAARVCVEFEFIKLTKEMDAFVKMWGINDVLCSVDEASLVFLFVLTVRVK